MRIFLIEAVLILLFASFNLALANENDIGQSKISPASPLYFLKTIRETLELKFAGTPHIVMMRELEFATRRLREVKSLILENHQNLIEPTLERYFYHFSQLPDQKLQNQEVSLRIKENLTTHLDFLQKIYYQVKDLRAKMAIRSVMNKMIQRMDVAGNVKLPVCNFLAKEASSSALNEVEKMVLAKRAIECMK